MMRNKISVDMVTARKVLFLKPIFEEDFVEKGMVAWLTDIVWDDNSECYKLFFDFSEFESLNHKYFKSTYYPNKYTKKLQEETGRNLFTAIETHNYDPKYTVYFSISDDKRDDGLFEVEISEYLCPIRNW